MIGRPRCREWTPLATQQLRLRSLIQIVGYNIRPPEWCSSQCSFYLTLHHTTMCAPFYTSERISSPHPKWKEIDSEITQKMSSSNIVIRIWCHIVEPREPGDGQPHDLVIQTWGVYFSGLRYIGANLALNFTSDCFKSNTLVFQMHGGYFCSYKSLKLDIIPPENEGEHGSVSSDSSGKTNLSKITLESKFVQQNKLKESRSISPSKYSKIEKEYSKSYSPNDRVLKQIIPTMKTSASLNIRQTQRDPRRRDESVERKVVDPNYIYEHSPDNLDVTINESCDKLSKNLSKEQLNSQVDLSETAENYDLRNESYGCPKYRYMALNFLKSEIRPSYNATKLQKLHLLQYSIKKRQEAVQEIKERIYKKSALANDLSRDDEEARVKCRSKSQRNLFSPEEVEKTPIELKNGRVKERQPSNGPRLTLKLNDLLSIKAKPSPYQRAEHVRLTKQMEILRFKRIILADERDSKLASIRRLKDRHAKLSEENQDVGSELMQAYHTLCKRWEEYRSLTLLTASLRESAARSHRSLEQRRTNMLQQLRDVFCIEQQAASRTCTICEVPFPAFNDTRTAAACEPVAAGYIAQAVTVAAAILHQPLRYKIILLGSASKIVDMTPDLPDPNIPLYPRGGDVTLFRYGLFLLNKCLNQLVWSRHLPVVDVNTSHSLELLLSHSHLPDVSKLYGMPPSGLRGSMSEGGATKAHSLRSLVHKQDAQFNRFKFASSGQFPSSSMNIKRHRLSRSVGSYRDDQEISVLDASTTSIMGSEPNIYEAKLSEMSGQMPTRHKHNSESEISRISAEQREDRVVFTLGDGEVVKIESDQLVKLSSNNEDECSTCLEQICTEINDFCNVNDRRDGFDMADKIDDINTIDIAKHMERQSEIEDINLCESCESNKGGECDLDCANNVSDVVVIPSAEAILDTGQVEVDASEHDQIASGEN